MQRELLQRRTERPTSSSESLKPVVNGVVFPYPGKNDLLVLIVIRIYISGATMVEI